MGLLKRCGGSNLCHYTKLIHNACYSVLTWDRLLSSTYELADVRCRRLLHYSSLPYNLRRHSVSSANPVSKYSKLFSVDLPPFVQECISNLSVTITDNFCNENVPKLRDLSQYSFHEGGKLIRPTVVLLMAGCCSSAAGCSSANPISESQKKVALVSEMIHTASLVHDDVIDESNERRNRPTVCALAGNKAAILIGDYILAKATQILTTIGDPDIVALLAQVIEDLVKGEFMQMGSRANEDDRFTHYILKTFKKTASLFAYSCKAVAKLAGCDDIAVEKAFNYGKNLGLAFQLIDDILDFVVQSQEIGKPTFTDLKLGIATAPVLFACKQHNQLNELILRRFSEPGDVDLAYRLVANSDGIMRSKQLAEQYCRNATLQLSHFPDSECKTALLAIASAQCSRNR